MIYDATLSRDGQIQKVRGNQLLLDKLVNDGYQLIDKLPLISHRPILPKDVIFEEVIIDSRVYSPVVIVGGL